MIRFVPQTLGGLAFDPVASALTALAPVFTKLGCAKIRYAVGDYVGDYPVDGSYAMTVDSDYAQRLASQDSFVIEVTTIMKDVEGLYTVEVINDLICAPSGARHPDGLTNGDFGSLEMCYPEALDPAKTRSKLNYDAAKSGLKAFGGRPFYAVIVTSALEGRAVCHGPSCNPEKGTYICTVDTDAGPMEVFTKTESPVYEEPIIETVPSSMDNQDGESFDFTVELVNSEGEAVKLALTQATTLMDGRVVNYVDYLRSLQIACLSQFEPESAMVRSRLLPFTKSHGRLRKISLPVERRGGRWYLTDDVQKVWAECCAENNWLKSLFSSISASDNELFLVNGDGSKIGSISKSGDSQSCYALSYAYVIALLFGGHLYDAIAAIGSALEAGVGIVADGKYIVANQKVWGEFPVRGADGSVMSIHKTGRGLATKSAVRGASYKSDFDIEWLRTTVGENGVFILGYDPDTSKPANNRSDHFIVARIRNNRVFVEFDPYRVEGSTTYARHGTDITASVNDFHEACVHVFRSVSDDT